MKELEEIAILHQSNKILLDCKRITFSPIEGGRATASGPGRIYQDETGTIRYVAAIKPLSFEHIRSQAKKGELIPRYKMKATTFDGDIWTATCILPNYKSRNTPKRSDEIASGSLDGIRKITAHNNKKYKNDHLEFILHKIDLPKNTSKQLIKKIGEEVIHNKQEFAVTKWEVDSAKFEVIQEFSYTIINVEFPKRRNALSERSRIVETLQYITGKQIKPIADIVVSKGKESLQITGRMPKGANKMLPPVQVNTLDPYPIEIFCAFFLFLRKSKTNDWSQISKLLRPVMLAHSISIHNQCLQTAIAVEGLANTYLPAAKTPNENKQAAEITKKLIDGCEAIPPHLKKRLKDKVSGITSADGSLRIKNFASEEQFKKWREFRNLGAHGVSRKRKTTKDFMEATNVITGLLHEMILTTINYSGIRTAWDKPEYPYTQHSKNLTK